MERRTSSRGPYANPHRTRERPTDAGLAMRLDGPIGLLSCRRRWGVPLSVMLAVACERSGAPDRRRHRLDASVLIDARATPMAADAAMRDATPDLISPRPSLEMFVVGGSEMVRPGATLPLRVEHFNATGEQATDVTRSATFHVHPTANGEVDQDGTFHALALGRAEISAFVGDDHAQMIVEVSRDLPAGVASIPRLQVSGHTAHSIRFSAQATGSVQVDIQAEHLSLSLEGNRIGNTFPITIPVHERPLPARADSSDAGPTSLTGSVVLDRWVARRLDGHATLLLADQPIQVRFTVFVPDPSSLLERRPR